MISDNLKKLGFEKWFKDNVDPADLEKFNLARVVAVHKDSYLISSGEHDISAELIGKMLFNADSPLDYPAVGDWVLASFYDENTFSIIHKILPRRSLLKRKTPGKKVDFQLIASNIDTAFIVQSLDTDFNLRRLERYLVMVKENNINPVVLLSKSDLFDAEDIMERIKEIHKAMPLLHVLPFSNKDKSSLISIKDFLVSHQTYCLLGSSGVGKTSLLNNLVEESIFTTGTVRKKDNKGRHTTTYRQLIRLDCEAMLIDTPGLRELGNFSVKTGIDDTFKEISALSDQCQFNDCSHVNEKGCAVLKAVVSGQISEKRYQNYMKIRKESVFNEMSYLERKKKDKQFGKLCKSVMKHKKSRV